MSIPAPPSRDEQRQALIKSLEKEDIPFNVMDSALFVAKPDAPRDSDESGPSYNWRYAKLLASSFDPLIRNAIRALLKITDEKEMELLICPLPDIKDTEAMKKYCADVVQVAMLCSARFATIAAKSGPSFIIQHVSNLHLGISYIAEYWKCFGNVSMSRDSAVILLTIQKTCASIAGFHCRILPLYYALITA